MKSNFFVVSINDLCKYGFLILSILLLVGFSTRYTNEVLETNASSSRLLPIYSVETEEKKVALTFDCAWGADDMEDIIDILEENEAHATFFLVGSWVDKYESKVKALSDAGHDVGNHSNNHAHVNKLSYEQNVEDMKLCNEKIKSITGEDVMLYRGPYGEYNNTVIEAAKYMNMQVIQWDIDTLDYLRKNPG